MPRRPRELGIPKTPVEYFGTELRAHREMAGLGCPQFAAKLGYSPQRIGQVERGDGAPSENFAKDCDTFFETNGNSFASGSGCSASASSSSFRPASPNSSSARPSRA